MPANEKTAAPEKQKSFFDQWLERISKIVTISGIIIGGMWFFVTRENFPHGEISQTVSHSALADKVLVHVMARLVNKGKVPMLLKYEKTCVYSVSPLVSDGEIVEKSGMGRTVDWGQTVAWRGVTYIGTANMPTPVPTKIATPGQKKTVQPASWDYESGFMRIEIGESEFVDWTFVVPSNTRKVRVYSFFKNESESGLGWQSVTYYDIPKKTVVSDEN
jgi:hypothetical protein